MSNSLGVRFLSGTQPERLWLRPECSSVASLRASCDCGSARQQVALPAGHRAVLTVGSEVSLWEPLLPNWVRQTGPFHSDIALRVHVDVPQDLIAHLAVRIVDTAIMYALQHRTTTANHEWTRPPASASFSDSDAMCSGMSGSVRAGSAGARERSSARFRRNAAAQCGTMLIP